MVPVVVHQPLVQGARVGSGGGRRGDGDLHQGEGCVRGGSGMVVALAGLTPNPASAMEVQLMAHLRRIMES